MNKKIVLITLSIMALCLLVGCGKKDGISKEEIYGKWVCEREFVEGEDYLSGKNGDKVTETYEFFEGDTGNYHIKNNDFEKTKEVSADVSWEEASADVSWELDGDIIKLYFYGRATSTISLKVSKDNGVITLTDTKNSKLVFKKK